VHEKYYYFFFSLLFLLSALFARYRRGRASSTIVYQLQGSNIFKPLICRQLLSVRLFVLCRVGSPRRHDLLRRRHELGAPLAQTTNITCSVYSNPETLRSSEQLDDIRNLPRGPSISTPDTVPAATTSPPSLPPAGSPNSSYDCNIGLPSDDLHLPQWPRSRFWCSQKTPSETDMAFQRPDPHRLGGMSSWRCSPACRA
jgi:hypothetical protein